MINELGQEKVAAIELLELCRNGLQTLIIINKPESLTIITVLKQRVYLRL